MENRRHLYHARISSHMSLQQIGLRTSLSPSVLRHIDEGRFELLPSGLYARSYVRAFASAVGLDPEEALTTVEPLLPGTPDPVALLNEVKGLSALERLRKRLSSRLSPSPAAPATPPPAVEAAEPAGAVLLQPAEPWPDAPSDPVPALLDKRSGPGGWTSHGAIRQTAAVVRGWPETLSRSVESWSGAVTNAVGSWPETIVHRTAQACSVLPDLATSKTLSPRLSRCGAAAIDALLLLVVDAFLVLLISWSSGVRVDHLLRDAALAVGAFCLIPVGLYFLLFGGIAGSTLGGYVCSLMAPAPDHPLTLPDILRRAVRR